jgi:peptidoglycan/LPS O-acetylase OafA/YrhL
MAVIFAHTYRGTLHDVFPWGYAGVYLFFVLSGFLISSLLFDGAESQRFAKATVLRNFYLRRALRIFPIYYLVLTLSWFFLQDNPDLQGDFGWHFAYLTNFRICLLGRVVPPFTHFWTLAVEEQFYLVWPLVILFIPKRRILPVLLATMVASFVAQVLLSIYGPNPFWHRYATPVCAYALALGALLGHLKRTGSSHAAFISNALMTAGIPLLAAACWLQYSNQTTRLAYDLIAPLSIALCSYGAIHWAVQNPSRFISGWMAAGPLVYLGKISYGVYLIHFTVLVWVQALLPKVGIASTGLLAVLLVFACSIGLAAISRQLLEQPLARLKKYFPQA